MPDRHYEVWSPEWEVWSSYEPVEVGRAWVVVMAPNAKAAKSLALRTTEFKEWNREARSDGTTPFKGVKARRFVCPHGTCWGCEECSRCLEESDAEAERVSA